MTAQFKAAFTQALQEAVLAFQPDVILCHHLYLLTALTRRLFPHIPVWGICHGTDLRQMETNPWERDYIRSAIGRLDKVCCLHQAQLEEATDCYGLAPGQASVVGSGFNQAIFFNRKERAPHREMRLVYAGKISEKKGVFSLLQALDMLGWPREAFSLRLAGGWGSEMQREQVNRVIVASGWDATLLGPLTQDDLAAEFNRGDIFVLPSFSEGLPLVLAESLACGMRAVCTDLPGIRPWMDANIPNHGIRFVQPPDMGQNGLPLTGSLPAFAARLAAKIREAAALPDSGPADLSRLSWQAVCQRILQ